MSVCVCVCTMGGTGFTVNLCSGVGDTFMEGYSGKGLDAGGDV